MRETGTTVTTTTITIIDRRNWAPPEQAGPAIYSK